MTSYVFLDRTGCENDHNLVRDREGYILIWFCYWKAFD